MTYAETLKKEGLNGSPRAVKCMDLISSVPLTPKQRYEFGKKECGGGLFKFESDLAVFVKDCLKDHFKKTVFENFPSWALNYVVNGDASSISESDKKMVDSWVENNIGAPYMGPEVLYDSCNQFCSTPLFGDACETYSVCFLFKRGLYAVDLPDQRTTGYIRIAYGTRDEVLEHFSIKGDSVILLSTEDTLEYAIEKGVPIVNCAE